MIYASRVIALFGLKVIENPDIVEKAKAEFVKETGRQAVYLPHPRRTADPVNRLQIT